MLLRSIILSVNLVSLYSYLSFLLLRSSKLDLGGMNVGDEGVAWLCEAAGRYVAVRNESGVSHAEI